MNSETSGQRTVDFLRCDDTKFDKSELIELLLEVSYEAVEDVNAVWPREFRPRELEQLLRQLMP